MKHSQRDENEKKKFIDFSRNGRGVIALIGIAGK